MPDLKPPRAPGRALPAALLVLSATLLAPTVARAQSSPFGTATPPGSQPAPARPPAPATPATQRPAAPPADQVIARVEGRPVTQAQFDQLGGPYFERLRAEMGGAWTPEVQRQARLNVLDELVRRQVLAVESSREGISVTEQETDELLRQDPSLQTDGRFDPEKLRAFKTSPQSNYLQLLPRLREFVAASKLDQQLRKRFTPSRDVVRAEYEKRNARVRFEYLPLLLRDVSLEPESSEPDWRAYYQHHGSEFVKRSQMRLRAFRLPLPAATDSTRAAAESLAFERGRRMADSLRAGTLADSATGALDTGLFDVGTPLLPQLGRVPELAPGIAQADSVPSLRVLGPVRAADAVIVASVVERRPKRPQTWLEALPTLKRLADAEKRRTQGEADRRAWFAANLARYRGPRAALTRLTLDAAAYRGRQVPPAEIDRWYQEHGHRLFGQPEGSKAWLPPITDSLRRVAGRALAEDERDRWRAGTLEKLAAGLAATRDPAGLARANGARAETLALVRGMPPDTLFPAAVVDSILATATAQRGLVQGPRSFGTHAVVWRVDSADTAFVPSFELVRGRIEQDFAESRRLDDERRGREWFDQHRSDYVTPVRYVVDYVAVPLASPDSVRLTEAELKAEYQRTRARFRREEEVHAQHLLITARGSGAEQDARAKARADSLLAAIRGGADFVELAKRFSQEPGAAASGGDLGWFGRGRMVPEFERAAFALAPGEVSGVVKTQFGYHIIRLEERHAAGTRSFAEVRDELRASLAAARADSAARRAARSLRRRLAVAPEPGPLAAAYGGIRTSPPFAPNEPAGALGLVTALGEDLPKLPAGRWAPSVYRTGRSFVVVRPARPVPSRPAEFDEVRAKAIEDAKTAQKQSLLDRRVEAIRGALAAGARLDSLAAPWGGLKDSGPLTRTFGFVPGVGSEPRLIDRAFAAKPDEVSDTLHVAQGVVWYRVLSHDPGDPAALESAQAAISQELLKRDYDRWLEERKRTMRIEYLRPEFRAARATSGRTAAAGSR